MDLATSRFIRLSALLRDAPSGEDSKSVTSLPSVWSTFNQSSKVPSCHNIKSFDLLPRKISVFVWAVKGDLGLKLKFAASHMSVVRYTWGR